MSASAGLTSLTPAAPKAGERSLLPRQCKCGAKTANLSGSCETCSKKRLQAKLRIGAPNDAYEQEADRVAGAVMRPVAATGNAAGDVGRVVQRADTGSAEQARGDGHAAPSSVDAVLNSPGQPLDPSARAFFEPRFGHDFSSVRIHADNQAAQSAREVSAHAYTVGRHVAFDHAKYSPDTAAGRQLLAHELTHVVQQGGAGAAAGVVQRDLATPPPAQGGAEHVELTAAQVARALAFNRSRYTAEHTREIQDVIGTERTGTWSEDDVRAVAQIQEEYRLTRDGIVGDQMFRFLNEEFRREKLPTDDAHCVTSFFVQGFPTTFAPAGAGQHQLQGHFQMRAQFPARCNCADFEYRQFIRGRFTQTRAGVVTDLLGDFAHFPGGGGLPAAFAEDGDTSDPVVNYGHRDQPRDAAVENHYVDSANQEDQAAGCIYRGEDFPGDTFNTQAGDQIDARMDFRGELQRRGRVVRTLNWTPINGRFQVP